MNITATILSATLALGFPATGSTLTHLGTEIAPDNSAYSVPLHNRQNNTAIIWQDSNGRSLSKSGTDLKLSLAPGDTLTVIHNGYVAQWKTLDGRILAKFDVRKRHNWKRSKIYFNPRTNTLATTSGASSSGLRCAGKWEAAIWNIAWDGLVCLPAGLATGGIGGFACGAAGTVIAAGVSC